ncbi:MULTISPECIES: DUF760 domain-containing protein [Cyanophyceae]|uniref:DUF760 domain-containing protein n=1 Tax=Cyanophyceae TaxID=3028117 RepID=UPI0007458954|nr:MULTISPECIES: DUF760 domain-containing protein [Cyanophyceae]AMA09501.1 hypothetical protein AWQ23_09330 [Picosynechococcus sp. PCC 73109]
MNNEAQSFYGLTGNKQQGSDELWHYVQSLSPEMIAHMSKPQSPAVNQVIERNIVGLLGVLSHADGFNVSVNMSREQLGQLLASAMMGGYFIRNAEQRFQIEKSLQEQDLNLPD